ncbi:MAG: VWA domain-containing protein [Bryobacterales bacterium]|nr:VWA domain-containing protein [Acidobacteriota bacterium]MCB9384358.1 VWA domain-containing protein [Bryobacterales bacterium]
MKATNQSRWRKSAVHSNLLARRDRPQAHACGSDRLIKIVLAFLIAATLFAQQDGELFTFETTTRLVIVNVAVQDRDGKPIEGLTADDFRILEDNDRQQISVFEFQRMQDQPLTALAPAEPRADDAERPRLDTDITPSTAGKVLYKDRRLLVLFFDFSSMPAEDQIRAQKSAIDFLDTRMTESDLVSIMTYSSELKVVQDFTDDRALLRDIISSFRVGEGSELADLFETDTELMEDDGSAFQADETEFNVFNTDRKLSALEDAARMLASLPEKKALVYFSSGVGRTGVENNSQLRSTINAAVRANLSFYPVDARGLVAEAPAGNASEGSASGTSIFSGRAQRQRGLRFENQQETLVTLAEDTGGKALLDNNDLALGIVQAQQAISSYYILGYYSTNPAMDGRFRRVKVDIPEFPKAKLDYRSGYFGPKDFEHFTSSDKERQLEEALLLEDPVTDLTLALEVDYFRLNTDRYFVPIAVKIPGSELELARKGGNESTRIDFIGQVRDMRGIMLGVVRDEIQVDFDKEASSQIGVRNLQYDSGFTLPPGRYRLKFLARENETGKMGTFETSFEVPDLGNQKEQARLSSVIWASQREAVREAVGGAKVAKKLVKQHPLIHDGEKLIPSVTRVFRRDQPLYVYFELYDPGSQNQRDVIPNVAAAVSFFRGGRKAFESEPVRADSYTKERRSVPVEFQIPLSQLQPGRYEVQLSVIDEQGKKFAFRRAPIILLPERPAPAQSAAE